MSDDAVSNTHAIVISEKLVADNAAMTRAIDRVWDRMARSIQINFDYPWLRRYQSPWPKAGHNPHARTFPEPESDYCDECGRPYDE